MDTITKIIGQEVEVALTKEDTRGTRKAPVSGDWIDRGELGVTPNKEAGMIVASNGSKATRKDQRNVGFFTEVTLALNPSRMLMAKIFEGAFGKVTVDDDNPESGVDTFAFEVEPSRAVPTYSINIIEGDNQVAYAGAMMTQVVIKSNAKEIPTLEITFVAKKRDDSVSGMTASYPSDNSYFSAVDAINKLADDYAGLSTADALDFIETTITITQAHQMHQYQGSETFSDISSVDWDIKVHIVKDYETMTRDSGDSINAQDAFEDNDTQAFSFEMIDTATTIGNSTNPSFKIEIPAVKLNAYKMNPALKAVVGEEFDLDPVLLDETNGFAIAEVVSDGSL